MTEEEIKALKDSNAALEAKNKELLEEKKKEKEKADKLAAEKTELENAALKEKGDYKAIVEKMEADNKLLKEQNEAKEKARINELKKGAFSIELDKLGIIPERKAFILASVDVSALQYVEAGNVVLGADNKAKEILAQMPEIFGNNKNNIPNGGGNGGGNGGAPADMSDEWFFKLSTADQDKHRKEYLAKKGITIR